MDRRLKLHEELCTLLGSRNVYFQPPESVKMRYPAIRYSLSRNQSFKADNKQYVNVKGYEVILIDDDPDSALPDIIQGHFMMCSFDRAYKADNLNHYAFTIYY